MKDLLALTVIIRECNGIEGRKKIQKMIYLLQQKGAPFHQEYKFHYYGVYSPELQNDLDQMASSSLGLIEEEPVYTGLYQSHKYKTTSKLSELLRQIDAPDVSKYTELAKQLSNMQPRELEALSTIVYLKKRGFSGERLSERFSELKPSLTAEYKNTVNLADQYT